EVVGLVLVVDVTDGILRQDGHSADRVQYLAGAGGRAVRRLEKPFRVRPKRLETTLRAEVVRAPSVVHMTDCIPGRDRHAADSIDHLSRCCCWRRGMYFGCHRLDFGIWDLGFGIRDLGVGIWDLGFVYFFSRYGSGFASNVFLQTGA